jgi:hypothetical protein
MPLSILELEAREASSRLQLVPSRADHTFPLHKFNRRKLAPGLAAGF